MQRDSRDHSGLDIGQVRGIGAPAFRNLNIRQVGEQIAAIDAALDWRAGRPGLSDSNESLARDPMFTSPLRQALAAARQ